MPSTHLSLHYHLVFSTKNREPWLSPTHRQRVHEYIGGTIRNTDGVAHAVGGTGYHIHIAAGLRATSSLITPESTDTECQPAASISFG